MNPAERRALQFPLLSLLAAIVLACAAGYYSERVLDDARLQFSQQEARLRQARVQLHRSGDEQEAIVRYLARYQELQRMGFAGDEARINWLDGLRLANERADLFGVEYQITAQAPYAHATELNPGDLVLHQSVMTMRLRLLHEADLLRFFGALREARAGMFAIDQCAINRVDAGNALHYQSNLVAECRVSWITAKPRRVEGQP